MESGPQAVRTGFRFLCAIHIIDPWFREEDIGVQGLWPDTERVWK